MCTSLRPGVAQHLHDLARGVAAHDRVVHDDDALAGDDLGQRVELQPQAVLAQLLAGLDEGARDVAVLDQPVVLREPGGAREAAGGRVAGVRHRDHEVGVDRRLAGEDLAHPAARDLDHLAAEAGVGPGEVDVLEDAQRASAATATAWRVWMPFSVIETISPGWTSRRNLAPMMSNAQVSRRDAVRVAEHAERERPQAERVAEGDDAVLGHHDGASRRPRCGRSRRPARPRSSPPRAWRAARR